MSDNPPVISTSTQAGAAWRAQALAQVGDLRAQLQWMMEARKGWDARDQTAKATQDKATQDVVGAAIASAVKDQLAKAESVITTPGPRFDIITGASVQAAQEYIDAAYVNLLRLAGGSHLRSLLPNLLMEASRHLAPTDRRLQALEDVAKKPHKTDEELSYADRNIVVASIQGAQLEAHREQMRVRSFRNVLLGVSTVIAIVAIIVAITGILSPTTFPLCFEPTFGTTIEVACPLRQSGNLGPNESINRVTASTVTNWDVPVVEFLGMLGATVAAAAGLQRLRGSADPFSLGVAVALLKLPTGAVTAFLGLLLIRAGTIPGLSALDSSAQIIGWAIVLGYSQQLFTRFVDQQAQTVLQQADSFAAPPNRARS
jgi:hypothetical protein